MTRGLSFRCVLTALQIASNSLPVRAVMQLRESKPHRHVSSKPHIIFILTDDQGFHDIGKRNKDVQTPFLDEFSKDALELDQYYAFPTCAPSRFSFLTGRYAFRQDAIGTNFDPVQALGAHLSFKMLPASLKQAGYKTHLVGKWHQGFHRKEYMPTNRGFDTFYGFLGGSVNKSTQSIDRQCSGKKIIDMTVGDKIDPAHVGQYTCEAHLARAVQLIKEHPKNKPFFLYLSLAEAHEPYGVPEKYSSLYSKSKTANGVELSVYYGMITAADEVFKKVVHTLKEQHMYDNSLVVFSSDNGAPKVAPHTSNEPLRGFKGDFWEGGMRVPAFVGGGMIPKTLRGSRLTCQFDITDWYATMAHIAGAEVDNLGPNGEIRSDSVNQWAYLTGELSECPRTEVPRAHKLSTGIGSFRMGDWKMVMRPDAGSPICQPCLYNIKEDPGEHHDLAGKEQERMSEISKRWEELKSTDKTRLDAFSVGPDLYRKWMDKACKVWTSAGHYLVPWAESDDEL